METTSTFDNVAYNELNTKFDEAIKAGDRATIIELSGKLAKLDKAKNVAEFELRSGERTAAVVALGEALKPIIASHMPTLKELQADCFVKLWVSGDTFELACFKAAKAAKASNGERSMPPVSEWKRDSRSMPKLLELYGSATIEAGDSKKYGAFNGMTAQEAFDSFQDKNTRFKLLGWLRAHDDATEKPEVDAQADEASDA